MLMCFGYVLWSFFEAPYGKIKNIFCLGSFSVLYCLMVILTLIASIFLLFVFISYELLKSDGILLVKGVLNLPTSLQKSLDNSVKIIDDVEMEINRVVDGLDRFNAPIDEFGETVNLTKHFMESQKKFDDINQCVSDVESCCIDLENGCGYNYNITFEEYYYQNSSEVVPVEIDDSLNILSTAVVAGKAGVMVAKLALKFSLGTFTGFINVTVVDLKEFLSGGIQSVVDSMEDLGINSAGVDTFSGWSLLGELSFLLICLMFYIFFILFFTCGLFCMCKSGNCLFVLSCCSCCGVIIHMTLGSFILLFFFVTDDTCKQLEYTISRANEFVPEYIYNILDFDIPTLGGGEIEVNLVNITRNVLYCGQPEAKNITTFFHATGISLKHINFTGQLEPYEKVFREGLDEFDLTKLRDDCDNFTKEFEKYSDLIPRDVLIRYLKLEKKINETYYDSRLDWILRIYLFSLKNETENYSLLNSILKSNCNPVYYFDRENILGFSTEIEPYKSNCNFDVNTNQTINIIILPKLHQFKNIFDNNIIVRSAVNNYTEIPETMVDYKENSVELDQIIKQILQTPQDTRNKLLKIEECYNQTLDDINRIVPNVIGDVEDRINSLPILECSNIGTFYHSLKVNGCQRIIISFGFIGFSTVILGCIYFLMFWVLLYTASMLKDYSKNFVDEDEYYDDDDLDDRGSFSSDYSGKSDYSDITDDGSLTDVSDFSDGSRTRSGSDDYSDYSDKDYK